MGAYDFPGRLRQCDVVVEIHKDHFNSDCEDAEWLQAVGKNGWVVLTSDRKIRSRQVEVAAMLRSGVAAFVFTAGTTAEANAKSFLKALPQVEGCLEKYDRPFVAQITASGQVGILATLADLIRGVGDQK